EGRRRGRLRLRRAEERAGDERALVQFRIERERDARGVDRPLVVFVDGEGEGELGVHRRPGRVFMGELLELRGAAALGRLELDGEIRLREREPHRRRRRELQRLRALAALSPSATAMMAAITPNAPNPSPSSAARLRRLLTTRWIG